MDPVRYRILGTTQALRPDGTPVAVGGARLRALLTVLALRAGRTVPAGLLVQEVWTGDPPADAPGALQALVGRLRRALGADAVASAEGGYRLTAGPDAVDLHRFERLTGDGLRALADGDPAKAAVLLDDALALWQGPPLADLPDRTAEAARREARRLDALRARHTAALALGHAEQSLPELTALCDAHPLDEPLQALRLRALRDAGRTAEALAAYEDVRRLLADRLGSDPGPELRFLHAELLTPAEARNPARGRADRGAPFGGPVGPRGGSAGSSDGSGRVDGSGPADGPGGRAVPPGPGRGPGGGFRALPRRRRVARSRPVVPPEPGRVPSGVRAGIRGRIAVRPGLGRAPAGGLRPVTPGLRAVRHGIGTASQGRPLTVTPGLRAVRHGIGTASQGRPLTGPPGLRAVRHGIGTASQGRPLTGPPGLRAVRHG
ncbi:BTAD domain-containing putative transcriptional regulator, partial [Streptomyces sp. NPDC052015]|uniref:AfsR/SARP family transcriptional regulator n=1 Tax=Streptomyces sp. NPDC052015 TaxID=3154755 RepID=UPI003446AC3D